MKQMYSIVKDYFRVLNLCVKKQYKCRKLLFVLFLVANWKLVSEDLGVFLNDICVEWGSVLVLLDKRISVLKHE